MSNLIRSVAQSAQPMTPSRVQQLKDALGLKEQEVDEGTGIAEAMSAQDMTENKRKYLAAVQHSLDTPAISTEAASVWLRNDGLGEKYGTHLSARQYMQERFARESEGLLQQATQRYQQAVAKGTVSADGLNDYLAGVRERINAGIESQIDRAAGSLAGTLKGRSPASMIGAEVKQLVAMHTPGQQFAPFAARTDTEESQVQQERGDARFRLTDEGSQNYKAQRLADLWSASSEGYAPGSTSSQFMRAVGGVVAPAYNRLSAMMREGLVDGFMDQSVNRNQGDYYDEMRLISEPDGKFAYASEMYWRGAGDNENQSKDIYTPEGRAKFVNADPTNPVGLVNATTENESYPLSQAYQFLGQFARPQEAAVAFGDALGINSGTGEQPSFEAERDLRNRYARTTPVVPDGVDPETLRRLGGNYVDADNALQDWRSATYGPAWADAYNATPFANVFGKAERTYLSPAGDMIAGVPEELVRDPINAAVNIGSLATGGVSGMVGGAFKGAAESGIRSLAGGGLKGFGRGLTKRLSQFPGRFLDDAVEEGVEGTAVIGPIMSGVSDFFTPMSQNELMPGVDANDPDYWKKYNENATDAMYRRKKAAEEWEEEKRRSSVASIN